MSQRKAFCSEGWTLFEPGTLKLLMLFDSPSLCTSYAFYNYWGNVWTDIYL